MKLVTMKCPNCGGKLTIDEKHRSEVCPYCNKKILLDDESIKIKHINTGEISEEQEFINAEINLNKFKDYDAAYKIYYSLSKRYSDNEEIWLGLVRSLSKDFTYINYTDAHKKMFVGYWKKYIALAKPDEINKYLKSYRDYLYLLNEPAREEQKFYETKKKNNKLIILIGRYILSITMFITAIGFFDKFLANDMSILTSIFMLLCSITIFPLISDKYLKKYYIYIWFPIILFIFSTYFSTLLPINLYGTWKNDEISITIKSEEDAYITVDGYDYLGTGSYNYSIYTLKIDSKEYEFKYDNDTKKLCLFEDYECTTYLTKN